LRVDAALEVAPVKIAFRAQDQRAGLPIVSGLGTANRAKYRSAGGRERHAADAKSAPVARQADADIAADIKPAPIGNARYAAGGG
jgi:hypothetical protein